MQKVKISLMDLLLAHVIANKKIITTKSYLLYNYIIDIIALILCGIIVICNPITSIAIYFVNNSADKMIAILAIFIKSIISGCQTVILLWLILLCITHIPIKKYTNIYSSNIKITNAIIIPQQIDKAYMFEDKIFIYKKINNRYKFLTIINPLDTEFNNQLFWKSHHVLIFNSMKATNNYAKD